MLSPHRRPTRWPRKLAAQALWSKPDSMASSNLHKVLASCNRCPHIVPPRQFNSHPVETLSYADRAKRRRQAHSLDAGKDSWRTETSCALARRGGPLPSLHLTMRLIHLGRKLASCSALLRLPCARWPKTDAATQKSNQARATQGKVVPPTRRRAPRIRARKMANYARAASSSPGNLTHHGGLVARGKALRADRRPQQRAAAPPLWSKPWPALACVQVPLFLRQEGTLSQARAGQLSSEASLGQPLLV